MITPNTPHDIDAVAELTAALTLSRQLATTARADLEAATLILVDALRLHSGQSTKLERILWSCWNDDYQINLCSELAGLDARLAQAAVAMISGRAHCGGDIDDLLRKIIFDSGRQTPP